MEKIKHFIESEAGKDILVVFIVILVGLASFELGRLSKATEGAGVKIENPDKATNQSASVVSIFNSTPTNKIHTSGSGAINQTGKNFFASSRGSKYYPSGCSAGKSIKQENRIYFNTSAEAEQAGYELSSSCK